MQDFKIFLQFASATLSIVLPYQSQCHRLSSVVQGSSIKLRPVKNSFESVAELDTRSRKCELLSHSGAKQMVPSHNFSFARTTFTSFFRSRMLYKSEAPFFPFTQSRRLGRAKHDESKPQPPQNVTLRINCPKRRKPTTSDFSIIAGVPVAAIATATII